MSETPNEPWERLRPEAAPLRYDALHLGQQDAFRRILYMLEEATNGVGRFSTQDGVEPHRRSNVVFLSGERGAGKTSVIAALMRYCRTKKHDNELTELLSGNKRRATALDSVRDHVHWLDFVDADPLPPDFNLISALIVRVKEYVTKQLNYPASKNTFATALDPSMHKGVNLLDHLQREAAVAWSGGLAGRRARIDFDSFAAEDARIAHASRHLNADFRNALNTLADGQLFSEKSIFVLPIDDTDLNPKMGSTVLRLLRMLSAPRLLTIAMGDIQSLEIMHSLEMVRTLNMEGEISNSALLPLDTHRVKNQIAAMSTTALRKMIPPEQRVMIGSWSIQDSLDFCPYGSNTRYQDLLRRTPVFMKSNLRKKKILHEIWAELHPCVGGVSVLRLLNFPRYGSVAEKKWLKWWGVIRGQTPGAGALFPSVGAEINTFYEIVKSLEDGKNSEHLSVEPADDQNRLEYFGADWLKSTPRRIADHWFAARRISAHAKRECESAVANRASHASGKKSKKPSEEDERVVKSISQFSLTSVRSACRQALMEETVFDPKERHSIDLCLSSDAGRLDWEEFPVTLRPLLSEPQDVIVDVNETPYLAQGYSMALVLRKSLGWAMDKISLPQLRENVRESFRENREYLERRQIESLRTEAASLVAFYHDAIQFSVDGDLFPEDFVDLGVYGGALVRDSLERWAISNFDSLLARA